MTMHVFMLTNSIRVGFSCHSSSSITSTRPLVIDKMNGKVGPLNWPLSEPLKRPKQIFRGRFRGTSRAHLAIYFVDDEVPTEKDRLYLGVPS